MYYLCVLFTLLTRIITPGRRRPTRAALAPGLPLPFVEQGLYCIQIGSFRWKADWKVMGQQNRIGSAYSLSAGKWQPGDDRDDGYVPLGHAVRENIAKVVCNLDREVACG